MVSKTVFGNFAEFNLSSLNNQIVDPQHSILKLKNDSLFFEVGHNFLEIKFDDVLGVEVNQPTIILKLFSFKKSTKKGDKPNREMKDFFFKPGMQYDPLQIQNIILCRILKQDTNEQLVKRKVLLLINPFSGAGAAAKNYKKVQPLLEAARSLIDFTYQQTERANHAYEIANEQLQPGQYDSIVTVSGDGLIFEVVNGLMNRQDKNEFLESITIGTIPGGTGNGLIKSLLDHSGEKFGPLEAAYMVIRGRTDKMDLTQLDLEYQPQRPLYSFLSTAWAVIADCDINSEVIRGMGSARFTIWGVWRCLSMIKYRGSFNFHGNIVHNRNQVAGINSEEILQNVPQDHGEFQDQRFLHFYAQNTAFCSKDINSAPLARMNDGCNDVLIKIVEQGAGNISLARTLIDQDNGDFFEKKTGDIRKELHLNYIKCRSWTLNPHIKGPNPNGPNAEGQISDKAILSIDGEKRRGTRWCIILLLVHRNTIVAQTVLFLLVFVQQRYSCATKFNLYTNRYPSGEKYPSQRINATVMPRALTVFV